MITSTDNQIYKNITKLKLKKNRDKLGKYIIEGPNLIKEALYNGADIELIVYSEGIELEFELESVETETTVIKMASGIFEKLSDTKTPQGVLAVVKKKNYSEEEFFQSRAAGASNIIVLDRLQDPGNLGTIIRTADAAGYMGAMILKGTGDIYSPKVARAAAGSLFRLPVVFVDTPEQAISLLKKYKKTTICTSLKSHQYYYQCSMEKSIALIIGNEGNGVCEEFIISSDIKVKIPMEGSIESLNVAVSAGILMYESVRQIINK